MSDGQKQESTKQDWKLKSGSKHICPPDFWQGKKAFVFISYCHDEIPRPYNIRKEGLILAHNSMHSPIMGSQESRAWSHWLHCLCSLKKRAGCACCSVPFHLYSPESPTQKMVPPTIKLGLLPSNNVFKIIPLCTVPKSPVFPGDSRVHQTDNTSSCQ